MGPEPLSAHVMRNEIKASKQFKDEHPTSMARKRDERGEQADTERDSDDEYGGEQKTSGKSKRAEQKRLCSRH